ncbi:glucosamine--fructose-6-phosphate aminotransferase [isomerizing] [Hydrogenimonas sp.]|nr:glucosamine--fructose-6-phosphate aminotransferase [isomerizing] [Hydrogenimonas sp.]
MCGIVGYVGKREIKSRLIEGLRELEYRGYDSAGIAIMRGGSIESFKAVGKLSNLEEKTRDFSTEGLGIGIGHTRWATHGKPTELNAHPHMGEHSYVVHNGIIENYRDIKHMLENEGVRFLSQTDTEVIVHLFEKEAEKSGTLFEAFKTTIEKLDGAYAVLLITQKAPDTVFFARKGSPMIIGRSRNGEIFFASSDAPLIGEADEVAYMEDGTVGFVTPDSIAAEPEELVFVPLSGDKMTAQKGGYRFFMEKEIYEQYQVMSDTMIGRVLDEDISFEELEGEFLEGISRIKMCACGTSYHAALTASYLFERLSKIPVNVEIASEFRYKEPLLTDDTLFIVISQSGETADTLEALRMAKEAGLRTLAVCNVDNSSIVRMADATILTRAGIEKGVASTKAFATQVMVLWMLSLFFAKRRSTLLEEQIREELRFMSYVPKVLQKSLEVHEKCKRLSKRYLHGHGFFFIGRDIFYPLALEGALKLKEISYLHAEGYPAGEMKHGPIALADAELFTIALMPKTLLYDKTKSNVEELSARDSTILSISPEMFDLADDFILIHPHNHPMLEFFEMMIVEQLLAMEIAVRLGNDVDMPRNLAKSVTVE